MTEQSYYQEIIPIILEKKPNKESLVNLKTSLCKKHGVKQIPTDIQILMNTPKEYTEQIKPILLTKPTRSISGVSVVAVMSAPRMCPHGRCIYCPGGPNSKLGNVPQSYTGKEPSTLRAIRNNYDPYLITMNRLEQYVVTGHAFDKIEVIIQGGTFPSYDKEYKDDFVRGIFKALNDFGEMFFEKEGKEEFDLIKFKEFFELPHDVKDDERTKRIQEKLLKKKNENSSGVEQEIKKNETGKIRCIGLTMETRSDYGKAKSGNDMLRLGCTRVELGIQSVYEDVIEFIGRKHTVQDNIDSIRDLRDLGFKINMHYMPGLPKTTRQQDLEGLKQLFTDPNYKPDMLKVYPCMVFEGTPLYAMMKLGEFTPLSTEQAADLIAEFKKYVPKYCRIMRVNRDIPSYMASGGVDKTNLRQIIEKKCKEKNIHCNCIRCREIGRAEDLDKTEKPELTIAEYEASEGKEFFIAYETKRHILGFARLRFPSRSLRDEITPTTALIRELHVYGQAIEIGKDPLDKTQHKGIGKLLMAKAEEIAKQNKKHKMVVISGVGVREYYKKLGYQNDGPYVSKIL
ncbi:tRNA uridine(34) 5-carboxymethylaminomethyl modification radical SAM/GNAT enzyme Elp3 [Candidatus Woesearchaeota archaeon]|nr:tRNA uridine(34) 5-carboxymethylaminomethyl modification radical SAM/GNAT enzyme Elp3 [Candidatus Woesearchaeota archaeon]